MSRFSMFFKILGLEDLVFLHLKYQHLTFYITDIEKINLKHHQNVEGVQTHMENVEFYIYIYIYSFFLPPYKFREMS